jgi:hypothetical protein
VLAVLAAAAVWRLASVDDALLRMLYS